MGQVFSTKSTNALDAMLGQYPGIPQGLLQSATAIRERDIRWAREGAYWGAQKQLENHHSRTLQQGLDLVPLTVRGERARAWGGVWHRRDATKSLRAQLQTETNEWLRGFESC